MIDFVNIGKLIFFSNVVKCVRPTYGNKETQATWKCTLNSPYRIIRTKSLYFEDGELTGIYCIDFSEQVIVFTIKYAPLSVYLCVLYVRIFYRWIIVLDEHLLKELYCQCWLSDTWKTESIQSCNLHISRFMDAISTHI